MTLRVGDEIILSGLDSHHRDGASIGMLSVRSRFGHDVCKTNLTKPDNRLECAIETKQYGPGFHVSECAFRVIGVADRDQIYRATLQHGVTEQV